jgi:hypothetical protein
MNQNRENFEKWFKKPLLSLYENEHAGFAVLMVTLPLLERLLRQRTNNHESVLTDKFHHELVEMFPTLKADRFRVSRLFWEVYRHGMMHRATLKITGAVLEVGLHEFAQSEIECSYTLGGYEFRVAPVRFSKTVIKRSRITLLSMNLTAAASIR